MQKDEFFKEELSKQFEFDSGVAAVFDDMVQRSVPYYKENLALTAKLCAKLAPQNASVCELGCSTANTLLAIFKLRPDLNLTGFDDAAAMLEIAAKKSKAYEAKIKLENEDILQASLPPADVYILNYTLQFIRPLKREALLKSIFDALNPGGFLILCEKISFDEAKLALKMIELYEEYKESQGYLKSEIARKRRALENVLIPFSEDENKQLLKNAGFVNTQSFLNGLIS